MSRSETLTLSTRNRWQGQDSPSEQEASGRHHGRLSLLLSGSLVMLLGSGLVSLINFGFNVAMARMLGPAEFADVTVAVTLLMLFSAMTLSFQLVGAKFVALNKSPAAKSAVYRELMCRAWLVSLPLGAALALFSGSVARYLRIPDPWLMVVLATGIAFYMPLGVKRGAMQGLCQFGRLSGNFLVEAAMRATAAVLLVALGYGVAGAIGAISTSVFVAFFFPVRFRNAPTYAAHPVSYVRASFGEGMQATVFFVGQVVINNIDIILVKHFFAARDAGMYAAVALVGRALYYAAWSVVSAMFPISAAAKSEEHRAHVLGLPLLVVFGISTLAVIALGVFPGPIVRIIFGSGFREAEPLLWFYAATTGLYALSVVMMVYEMSRRIANTGWLQLLISGITVIGITLFHHSLHQVIVVQMALMVVLLVLVALPFLKTAEKPASWGRAA